MRYYIVDNKGNVICESQNGEKILAKFDLYTENIKPNEELEIIEGR